MPEPKLEELLEAMLATIRERKAHDELEELRARKFTLADLEEALETATPADLDRLRARLALEAERQEEELEEEPVRGSRSSDDLAERRRRRKPAEEEKPKRTRPGRKAGHAYTFTVDDTGRVVELPLAQVYAGADEPDEVELPDDELEETGS